jgi:hypothetical protein
VFVVEVVFLFELVSFENVEEVETEEAAEATDVDVVGRE